MSQVSSNVAELSGTIVEPAPVKKAKKAAPKQRRAEKKTPIVKSTSKGKGQTIAKSTSKEKVNKSTSKGKGTTAPATKSAKDRKGSFYLSDEQITEYKAEFKESGVIPIPYNSGAYRSFLLALVALKADKAHPFKAVKEKMKEIMSDPDTKVDGKTQWQRYTSKEGASDIEDNCLGVDAKLHQNAEVLQRLGGNTPYGMKLLQIGKVIKSKGVVVDILKGKDGKEKLYRLNINASAPTNEFKRARKAE